MGDKAKPPRVCETPEQPYYLCGPSEWQDSIQSSFSSKLMARLLCPSKSPQIICQYPGLAAYFFTKETADAAVDLISLYVSVLNFDGVYLDGYLNAQIRYQVTLDLYSKHNISGCGIDVDGDDMPESIQEANVQGIGWGQYMVSKLRRTLGKEKIIIGNAGGVNSDPLLNGITVEMEYCTDESICSSAFLSSQQSTLASGIVSNPISVAWLKDPVTFPPDKQCAFAKSLHNKYPWVSIGVDIFDGEPVFCGF